MPIGEAVVTPMRRRGGSRVTAFANTTPGSATRNGSPGSGPVMTSSASAVSRTLREITPSLEAPYQYSPKPGPEDTRPRDGFSPNRPQQAAGMRMEPPPSLPAAIGTTPEATAAAAPPLEPPDTCAAFQGLLTRPKARESDTPFSASSGRFVLPKITRPASI